MPYSIEDIASVRLPPHDEWALPPPPPRLPIFVLHVLVNSMNTSTHWGFSTLRTAQLAKVGGSEQAV